jgi:hypothetical protein
MKLLNVAVGWFAFALTVYAAKLGGLQWAPWVAGGCAVLSTVLWLL